MFMFHVKPVTFHVPPATCHLSPVTWHLLSTLTATARDPPPANPPLCTVGRFTKNPNPITHPRNSVRRHRRQTIYPLKLQLLEWNNLGFDSVNKISFELIMIVQVERHQYTVHYRAKTAMTFTQISLPWSSKQQLLFYATYWSQSYVNHVGRKWERKYV